MKNTRSGLHNNKTKKEHVKVFLFDCLSELLVLKDNK